LILFAIALFASTVVPFSATAWGGKPWNSMHQEIECELEIDPSFGGLVNGQIECPEQEKTWLDSYHPDMRSDAFSADSIGTTYVQFSLRPWFAAIGNRHGTMSCSGTWERSTWGGSYVTNDFGVRCVIPGHADIACVDWLVNTTSRSFADSLTLRCSTMEFFDGKEWIYWDIDHGYDASVKVKVMKSGIVRATPNDPQPDLIGTVRFKIENRATNRVRVQDVAVTAGNADFVLPKSGRFLVTVYFCTTSACDSIPYSSETFSVTR
jgi:hypothetical protein